MILNTISYRILRQFPFNPGKIAANNLALIIYILTIFLSACSYGPLPQMPQHRPQNPQHQPYIIKQISFSSVNTGVQLAGELTIPYGSGPYPGVILISGSGQQDRDETVLGHKPFLVISDYLTRMGFAVLRYDDRGVGKSTGQYASADLRDFADDAAGAYLWLQKQPNIALEKIGYLGHSEGGYIAPLASLSNSASFMIILAGSAKPLLPDVVTTQAQTYARTQWFASEKINYYQRHYLKLTGILQQANSVDDAKQKISHWLNAERASKSEIDATLNMFANRWGMHFARYDPQPTLAAFSGPVLALFGDKDVQVSAQENAVFMEESLSNSRSTVCTLANMNHLFQRSTTGRIDEYHKISTTIEPEVLELISHWLKIITETNTTSTFNCEFRATNKMFQPRN